MESQVKDINLKLEIIEKENNERDNERIRIVNMIPNIIEDTVPVNKGDENNKFTMDIDFVIEATGQETDFSFLGEEYAKRLKLTPYPLYLDNSVFQ